MERRPCLLRILFTSLRHIACVAVEYLISYCPLLYPYLYMRTSIRVEDAAVQILRSLHHLPLIPNSEPYKQLQLHVCYYLFRAFTKKYWRCFFDRLFPCHGTDSSRLCSNYHIPQRTPGVPAQYVETSNHPQVPPHQTDAAHLIDFEASQASAQDSGEKNDTAI